MKNSNAKILFMVNSSDASFRAVNISRNWQHKEGYRKRIENQRHDSILEHAAGTSINFAFCEEIINSDIPFITVVYEKIFGSINK